jgi:hypothetical protein
MTQIGIIGAGCLAVRLNGVAQYAGRPGALPKGVKCHLHA